MPVGRLFVDRQCFGYGLVQSVTSHTLQVVERFEQLVERAFEALPSAVAVIALDGCQRSPELDNRALNRFSKWHKPSIDERLSTTGVNLELGKYHSVRTQGWNREVSAGCRENPPPMRKKFQLLHHLFKSLLSNGLEGRGKLHFRQFCLLERGANHDERYHSGDYGRQRGLISIGPKLQASKFRRGCGHLCAGGACVEIHAATGENYHDANRDDQQVSFIRIAHFSPSRLSLSRVFKIARAA